MTKESQTTKWKPGNEPPINGDVVLGYTPGKQLKFTAVYHDGHYWRNSFYATTTVHVEKWMEIPNGY